MWAPPKKKYKNKDNNYNNIRWKHKWELLRWQEKIPAHVSHPHASMETATENVTASSYACRTIVCILPPCAAYVMVMPGCEIWAAQMSLDKAKFKQELWDSKFSVARDCYRETWWAEVLFFSFFLWFSLQSKKGKSKTSTYSLIPNSRREKGFRSQWHQEPLSFMLVGALEVVKVFGQY